MDVEHARTFVAVMETASFSHAAERLFVTQSTVSARIRTLEDRLGCRLFDRSKAGVFLTPAGNQFTRHARKMVQIWGQARQELALPETYSARLNIGAQISHWDDIMVSWVCWLRQNHPDLAVRAEIGSNESLMRQIADGLLDLAVIYTPQIVPGLKIEKLFDENIVLVSTRRESRRKAAGPENWQSDYVFVDWGPEYRVEHGLAWPDMETPAVHFGVGTVALEFILRQGGSGYFPYRMVREMIGEKRLFAISGAPSFRRSVYLVMAPTALEPQLDEVISGLRRIAVTA
jgi:LysR family transcriptional regulator, flagellar master operon regulator